MKYFKTYESFINEAKLSKVFKAAKKGSYPATIVVIKDKKVIHQEQVNTPEAIPAAFNVLQRKYPKAIITVEDKTGATLYREVDEAKNYMQKIDLKDFKAIKKGTKLLYMGGEAEVVDNNGFVLTLKQNGKKFTVNKSMFDHGGMISEAFIGPFVFNDRMSDEELKAMYNGALDGYANYSKGFQHPKSDYKKAYQEIEKILKKRGVSVDESVVTEAEMTKKTFLDLWKETYGENFISEYPAVAKILKNRPNDIDKREISRIWDETYGEDFKEEYPGIWNKLD